MIYLKNPLCLGRNMAYMLKCKEAAAQAGVSLPEQESAVFTNFIR